MSELKLYEQYTVTVFERLRKLCIDKNWFTEGTNNQYNKLFYANEMGCPIEEIATIIWLCSDTEIHNGEMNICRRDILRDLVCERIKFLNSIEEFEIMNQTAKKYEEIIGFNIL